MPRLKIENMMLNSRELAFSACYHNVTFSTREARALKEGKSKGGPRKQKNMVGEGQELEQWRKIVLCMIEQNSLAMGTKKTIGTSLTESQKKAVNVGIEDYGTDSNIMEEDVQVLATNPAYLQLFNLNCSFFVRKRQQSLRNCNY